jgi:hypothetical protein
MIFVLEIKGTPVMAFDADNMDDARAYAEDPEEREDLKELTSNGLRLWNGTDPIDVRAATEDEADLFEEMREDDWEEEPHADPEDFAVYLVPLDDIDGDDEEDEDED